MMPISLRAGHDANPRLLVAQPVSQAGLASATLLVALLLISLPWCTVVSAVCAAEDQPVGELVTTAKVTAGDLAVEFLDNAQSPQILSGVDRLFNTRSAPDFDAFDPHDPPSSAGLNYEHIISATTILRATSHRATGSIASTG